MVIALFLWLMLAGTYAVHHCRSYSAACNFNSTCGSYFKTNLVLEFIENNWILVKIRLFPKEYQEIRVVDISDILLLFSTQAFWIGILASVILVAGIVYVRSSNSDHAID